MRLIKRDSLNKSCVIVSYFFNLLLSKGADIFIKHQIYTDLKHMTIKYVLVATITTNSGVTIYHFAYCHNR